MTEEVKRHVSQNECHLGIYNVLCCELATALGIASLSVKPNLLLKRQWKWSKQRCCKTFSLEKKCNPSWQKTKWRCLFLKWGGLKYIPQLFFLQESLLSPIAFAAAGQTAASFRCCWNFSRGVQLPLQPSSQCISLSLSADKTLLTRQLLIRSAHKGFRGFLEVERAVEVG